MKICQRRNSLLIHLFLHKIISLDHTGATARSIDQTVINLNLLCFKCSLSVELPVHSPHQLCPHAKSLDLKLRHWSHSNFPHVPSTFCNVLCLGPKPKFCPCFATNQPNELSSYQALHLKSLKIVLVKSLF